MRRRWGDYWIVPRPFHFLTLTLTLIPFLKKSINEMFHNLTLTDLFLEKSTTSESISRCSRDGQRARIDCLYVLIMVIAEHVPPANPCRLFCEKPNEATGKLCSSISGDNIRSTCHIQVDVCCLLYVGKDYDCWFTIAMWTSREHCV